MSNFLHFHNYLKRCLESRVLLQADEILRSLLPKAAERGLIPRSGRPVPF